MPTRLRSAFGARAARRNRRQRLIARAPKPSPKIESRYRLAVSRVMQVYSNQVLHHLLQPPRHDAAFGIHAAYLTLKEKAKQTSQQFRETAFETAARLEKASKEQAAKYLGDLASDLPERVAGFAEDFVADAVGRLEGLMDGALDASMAAVEAVSDETASETLSGILDGWVSRAIQSAKNVISSATTDLTQERSESAGVTGYYWIATHDVVTRPEHGALDDGTIYTWDDPPLSAEDADSGEACHPGQDFGCRCFASPAVGAGAGEAGDDESVAEAA